MLRFIPLCFIAAVAIYFGCGTKIVIAEPGDEMRRVEGVSIAEKFNTEVTAYSSSPDEADDTPFISADGNTVYDGLAACPRRYDFGTRVMIDNRIYTCGDRLAEKYDHRFDIWKATKQEAIDYGMTVKEVAILAD